MLDNIHKKGTAAIENLIRRIQELEDDQAHLKQQMLNCIISRDQQLSDFQTSNSVSSQSRRSTISEAEAGSSSFRHCPPLRRGTLCARATRNSGRITHRSTVKLREAQYFNILESVDLPISINDAQGIVIYRNQAWDRLYGYTGAEVLGKPVFDLVVDPKDAMIAKDIIQQMYKEGKSWTGEFPARNKEGVRFVAFASNKTLADENGAVEILSITADSRLYLQQINPHPTTDAPCRKLIKPHPQPPIQSAIVSKISDLVNVIFQVSVTICLFNKCSFLLNECVCMCATRGMNHLHHCLPHIIHYDLKSSNILVDKKLDREEWMAPEVLCNEEADEKSDVYSYGVVLWEFTTEKIPWDGLNAMQVIKTVGLMNQRLDIPKDVNLEWASLIEKMFVQVQ